MVDVSLDALEAAKKSIACLQLELHPAVYKDVRDKVGVVLDAVSEEVDPVARPSRDAYFMGFARHAGKMATCDRGKAGACIVKNGKVISTGYVGAASKLDHCDDVGHLLRKVIYLDEEKTEEDKGSGSVYSPDDFVFRPVRSHCMRTAHAEGNAIVQAARFGIAVEGATMYCKMEPCLRCCVDIINAGIVRVVAEYRYHGAKLTREWFEKAGVELVVLNDDVPDYAKSRAALTEADSHLHPNGRMDEDGNRE